MRKRKHHCRPAGAKQCPPIHTVRLSIRGYAGKEVVFHDRLDIEEAKIEDAIADVATAHAHRMASHELQMIEIEFLDEPDPLARYFRFGTDPSGMVAPIEVGLPNA